MKLSDLIPQFKRYALIERGITSRVTKEIIKTVENLIESKLVSTIKNSDTLSIRNFLYQEKENKLWSNRTFRNKRQYLKSFYDFCIRYGYMSINPVEKIEKPKIPKSLPRCLNKRQVDRILLLADTIDWNNQLASKRNQAMLRTFLYTGMRLSELQNLKSNDVSLDEREIFISKGKGQKDRIIPIHPELFFYLKSYKSKKKKSTNFFFSSLRSDSRLTQKNIYAIFKKIKKRCDFNFTPHMLRHTMGKMAIEANLNPFMLQSILGHADISTTQIYVSVSKNATKEAFEKLDLI